MAKHPSRTMAFRIVAASTLALAVAGCAKKKPDVLPPPPATSPTDVDTPPPGDGAGGPGSRADFLRSAGTDTIHFGTDIYDVDSQSQAILLRQAQWLQRYPNVRVTIEGHADERGTREYNLALGDRRANSAKNFLAANGVDAGRISVISYGKERPVATGSDDGAWAANRRAVTVVPISPSGGANF